MSARKLPDLSTLIRMRQTHTAKEIAAIFGCNPSTVCRSLARAEALMLESKRRGWAAWEAKCILIEVEGRREVVRE